MHIDGAVGEERWRTDDVTQFTRHCLGHGGGLHPTPTRDNELVSWENIALFEWIYNILWVSSIQKPWHFLAKNYDK